MPERPGGEKEFKLMNPFASKMMSFNSEIIRHGFGVASVHLTEGELRGVESEVGYSLPKAYRHFLTDYGGHKIHASYVCQDSSGQEVDASIGIFYGVFESSPHTFDPSVDLLRIFRSTIGERPGDILPIGYDRGLGITCIRLSGESPGTVYYWEREEFFEANDYSDLYWVCESFEAFMDMLVSD